MTIVCPWLLVLLLLLVARGAGAVDGARWKHLEDTGGGGGGGAPPRPTFGGGNDGSLLRSSPEAAADRSLVVSSSLPMQDLGAVAAPETTERRALQPAASNVFFVNTTEGSGPLGVGNPNAGCTVTFDDNSSFTYVGCINGCRSRYYSVTGTGASITASTCGAPTSFLFYQQLYVWEGGACADFSCVTASNFNCPEDGGTTAITWASELGVPYHVQITGVDTPFSGTTTITFTGTITPVVTEVEACFVVPTQAPTKPPTNAPTNVPTREPTNPPTRPPTKPPTGAPTKSPTRNPTAAPTDAPTELPPPASCPQGTTFWIRDASAAAAPIRRIGNNTAACLVHPYNLEVRPCRTDGTVKLDRPVRVRLVDAARRTIVHRSDRRSESPFLLYGGRAASPRPLPNGPYLLEADGAPEWGRLAFTQSCRCRKGQKGRKGCMD